MKVLNSFFKLPRRAARRGAEPDRLAVLAAVVPQQRAGAVNVEGSSEVLGCRQNGLPPHRFTPRCPLD